MNFSNEEIVALKAAKTQTLVFWDLVECPIPEGMDVVTVSGNIRDALKKEGYQGQTVIRLFGDTSQYSPDVFSKALVELVHLPKRDKEGDEEARRQMILAHLLCGAVAHLPPVNLMLIMGDLSGLLQFCSAFHVLRWSDYNCMLVQPQDSPMLYEHSVTTAWLWDTLSSGGKPLRSVSLLNDTSVSTSSSQETKSLSLSSAATEIEPKNYLSNLLETLALNRKMSFYSSAQTIIFWDIAGCPVPDGLDVNGAEQNIEHALGAMGCGNVFSSSVKIYCDILEWKDVLCETNFPMLHAATEATRRQKILVDFMNEAIGGREVNLMLIMPDLTGHPEFLHCFKSLKERNINVLLAQPHRENVSKELLSSVGAVWLWSSLSRGHLPIGEEYQGSEYASTDSEA